MQFACLGTWTYWCLRYHCRPKLCATVADAPTAIIFRFCFHCGHKAPSHHDQCSCGEVCIGNTYSSHLHISVLRAKAQAPVYLQVSNETTVHVRRPGNPKKWRAKVLCEGKIADLALVTVEDDQFWTNELLDLQFVDVPELQASIARHVIIPCCSCLYAQCACCSC